MTVAVRPLRPPITYLGGKVRLARRLAALIPHRDHYVEPYAGALSVLLARPPARMETANDLDGELMTWWRVLRDRPRDLEQVCALTPHSRAEHAAVYDASPADELEVARRVWVRLTQGRGRVSERTGWRHHCSPAGATVSMPSYLDGYLGRFGPAAQRLHQVSLESRPALDLVERYGRHEGVVLYVDPPYLASTRSAGYRHEMAEADHRELAEALRGCRAAVVLSGYASDLYDQELYPDWRRRTLAASTTQGSAARARTEVLWSNVTLVSSVPEEPSGPDKINEES